MIARIRWTSLSLACGFAAAMAVVGCVEVKSTTKPSTSPAKPATTEASKQVPEVAKTPVDEKAAEADEIKAVRAKLSPEDRKLVEAQEWCAINNDERLGSMGEPVKVTLDGKTVFLCCGGCKKAAEKNPAKTLAKVEELKAKKAAETKN